MRARRQQNAQACASDPEANRAHTCRGLIGGSNVRFAFAKFEAQLAVEFCHPAEEALRSDGMHQVAGTIRRRRFCVRSQERVPPLGEQRFAKSAQSTSY